MAYLIDTNIAIHARDGHGSVLERLLRHDGQVVLSVLSLVELQRGLHTNAAGSALRRARTEALLGGLPVLPFDEAAAGAYGQIIAQCGWVRGRDYDLMIGAHALSTASVLVTDNLADFRDIPGLSLEDWTNP